MTLDEIKVYLAFGFQAINALATVGIWLYVRYGDRNKEVDGRFEQMKDDLDNHRHEENRRLAAMEVSIARAPTHQDLSMLHEKMNGTSAVVNQMAGEVKGINENLRLILNRIAEKGMP